MSTELRSLSPLLANPDFRYHPYAQPLNTTFSDVDLLLFALQIASAMDHLTQKNVRTLIIHVYTDRQIITLRVNFCMCVYM